MKTDFPDEFYRGVTTKDAIKNDRPLFSAFSFDDSDNHTEYVECSINWNDSSGSMEEIKNRTKENGQLQFIYGILELNTKKAKIVFDTDLALNNIKFERRKTNGNVFHGNILANKQFLSEKLIRRQIQDGLCLCVTKTHSLES